MNTENPQAKQKRFYLKYKFDDGSRIRKRGKKGKKTTFFATKVAIRSRDKPRRQITACNTPGG